MTNVRMKRARITATQMDSKYSRNVDFGGEELSTCVPSVGLTL
jgi:hypothetical protein